MKQESLINLIGASLIGAALIIHIVCLSTPYYSQLDVKTLFSDVMKMAQKMEKMSKNGQDGSRGGMPQGGGMGQQDFSSSSGSSFMGGLDSSALKDPEVMDKIKEVWENAKLTVGIWKVCFTAKMASMGVSFEMCPTWGSADTSYSNMDTSGLPQLDEVKGPGWMKAVQAMAIIGMLVMAAGTFMAVVNVVVPSKGDRLRLMPVFISVTCFIGGVICAVGYILFAAKFKSLVQDTLPPLEEKPAELDTIIKMVSDELYLSWGFSLDVLASVVALLAGIVLSIGNRVSQFGGGIV